MKKITSLLFILLAVSLGYSQQVVLEDFDGAAPAIAGFEGLGSAAIVSGELELISSAAGQPWQGAELILATSVDLTSDITIEADVTSSVAFDLFAKVELGTGPDSATATAHTGSGTETLVFTFNQSLDGTGNANGEYGKLVFFPNWDISGGAWGTPADFTITIDNITGVAVSAATCTDGIQNGDETGVDCGGTSCAACPPTCTDGIQNGDETGVDCGGTSCAPCTPPTCTDGIQNGDETGVDCGGTSCAACPPSGMKIIIEDFDGTAPTIAGFEGLASAAIVSGELELISSSAGQPWQGAEIIMQNFNMNLTSDIEVIADVTSSVAFDLFAKVESGTGPDSATATAHTGTGTESLTFTFNQSLDGTGNANGEYGKLVFFPNWDISGGAWGTPADFTITIDNIQAVPGATLSVDSKEVTSFRAYPNPSRGSWNIASKNQVISNIQVYDILGKEVLSLRPNTTEAEINGASLKSGLYFAKVKSENGSVDSIKLIKQ